MAIQKLKTQAPSVCPARVALQLGNALSEDGLSVPAGEIQFFVKKWQHWGDPGQKHAIKPHLLYLMLGGILEDLGRSLGYEVQTGDGASQWLDDAAPSLLNTTSELMKIGIAAAGNSHGDLPKHLACQSDCQAIACLKRMRA